MVLENPNDEDSADPPDLATGRAFQVLDEVALRILEIRLAILAVTEDVASLRLDDFHPLLTDLELLADGAVGAAGLLLVNPDLDQASLPAVKRHGAFPPPSSLRRFNESLDAIDDPASTPPSAGSAAEMVQYRALAGLGRTITADWLRRRHEPGSLYRLITQPGGPFQPPQSNGDS